MNVFYAVLARDIRLATRAGGGAALALAFFAAVAALVPLGVGADLKLLGRIAAGVLWVAAVLASMLSLGRMFSADYLDGTLEQILLAPQSLSVLVLGKIVAHWMVSGLPLVLMAPVLGLQFGLPADQLGVLMLALLLGTPVLSMIGAVGAALTLGLRGGGVLVSLLVLPRANALAQGNDAAKPPPASSSHGQQAILDKLDQSNRSQVELRRGGVCCLLREMGTDQAGDRGRPLGRPQEESGIREGPGRPLKWALMA